MLTEGHSYQKFLVGPHRKVLINRAIFFLDSQENLSVGVDRFLHLGFQVFQYPMSHVLVPVQVLVPMYESINI